jgi:hypothetical protein
MKKYKPLLLVLIIMIITLTSCFIFIKPKTLKFKNTNEYIYFENHINDIDKIELKTYTLLGITSYKIDNKIGKDFLLNLKIKKETDYTITDSDASLIIYYKSGKKTTFNFEYNNFKYKQKKYKVNNDVWNLIQSVK